MEELSSSRRPLYYPAFWLGSLPAIVSDGDLMEKASNCTLSNRALLPRILFCGKDDPNDTLVLNPTTILERFVYRSTPALPY